MKSEKFSATKSRRTSMTSTRWSNAKAWSCERMAAVSLMRNSQWRNVGQSGGSISSVTSSLVVFFLRLRLRRKNFWARRIRMLETSVMKPRSVTLTSCCADDVTFLFIDVTWPWVLPQTSVFNRKITNMSKRRNVTILSIFELSLDSVDFFLATKQRVFCGKAWGLDASKW